ncbi:MAG: CPBP family intramembrane metalloprotease [Armatimonadetes bacterium]|nr:CPBP family intramembrane metalloprotease [Armatimonadota bacterium]
MLALAYPDPSWSGLAWVALAPLFAYVAVTSPRRAAVLGLVFGIAFHLVLMRWLVGFGIAAYVLLILALSTFTALFAFLASAALWRRPRAWMLLACPAAWIGVEWLRTLGTLAAPWGLLGYTQWQRAELVSLSSVGGVFLVSATVAMVNGVVAWGLTSPGRMKAAARVAQYAAVVALLVCVGWFEQAPAGAVADELASNAAGAVAGNADGPVPAHRITVGITQTNVPQHAQFDPGHDEARREQLERLTRQAIDQGADVVVWPEGAWPGVVVDGERAASTVASLSPTEGALIATGFSADGAQTAAVVAGPVIQGRQDKVRLVPFGEAGLVPGSAHRAVPTPFGAAGIAICYESIDPQVARALARDGARILYFVTNDAWFADAAGPRQHLMFSVFRAAESGRDVVRAASTGPSAHVTADGRVRSILPWGGEGVLAATATLRDEATPYARFGHTWLVLPWAVVAALAWPWTRRAVADERTAELLRRLAWPGVIAFAGAVAASLWPSDLVRALASAALAVATLRLAGASAAGLRGGNAVASVASSSVLGGVVLLVVMAGFAAQGFPKAMLAVTAAAFPWIVAAVVSFGEEVWLRGAVGGALIERPWLIVAISVAGTWLLHLAAPAELAAWRLVAAAANAFIRVRTGSVWGPVIARGGIDVTLVSLLGLAQRP